MSIINCIRKFEMISIFLIDVIIMSLIKLKSENDVENN